MCGRVSKKLGIIVRLYFEVEESGEPGIEITFFFNTCDMYSSESFLLCLKFTLIPMKTVKMVRGLSEI